MHKMAQKVAFMDDWTMLGDISKDNTKEKMFG